VTKNSAQQQTTTPHKQSTTNRPRKKANFLANKKQQCNAKGKTNEQRRRSCKNQERSCRSNKNSATATHKSTNHCGNKEQCQQQKQQTKNKKHGTTTMMRHTWYQVPVPGTGYHWFTYKVGGTRYLLLIKLGLGEKNESQIFYLSQEVCLLLYSYNNIQKVFFGDLLFLLCSKQRIKMINQVHTDT